MIERIFVDTNVLVYMRDSSEKLKQRRASEWIEQLWATQSGRLSVQVLQEFYVTVTQKLKPGMTRAAAREDVRNLSKWRAVGSSPELLEVAWRVQDDFRVSWWDSLIVAAALRTDCRYVLTEDLDDGTELDGVRIIDPFRHEPASIITV